MNESPSPKRARRIWIALPWLVFVVAAAVWCAYWFAVANGAMEKLSAWAASERAKGAEVSFGAMQARGFPVQVRVALHDVAYAPAGGGWRAQTSEARVHVDPLNPAHVMFEARAPIAIHHGAGETSSLGAEALLVSLRFAGEAIAAFGVEADGLTLDNAAQEGALGAEKFVANLRPDPRGAGAYQLALEGRSLTLARPVRSFEGFGQDVALARAAIVLTEGAALLDPLESDPFAAWREAGGRARFEAFELQWGPLAARARGEAGLDALRRLDGRLDVDIDDPGPAVAALAQSPSLPRDARQALMVLGAGLALSRQDASFKVTAQDGALGVEGATVRTLSPLY